jgi:multiple sugar transport system substrate-binding protein
MATPAFGVGKLAGTPTMDVQGIGIASGSANKELAAEFLRLMHRKDRLDAIYKLGGFPADKSFDASQVEGDVYKTMWDMIQNGIVYMSDVVPYAVTDGAANSGCQQLFAGQATPEDLGKEAQRLLEEWASQNPDMLENYVNWMK